MATFLLKLVFIFHFGLRKNNLLIEHSLLFLFSRAEIRNSFYKPATKYMRISNRLTYAFYVLTGVFGILKFFELVVV